MWYIKGTFNNWAGDPRYQMILSDEEKPAGSNHQYTITINLTEGDEFQFNEADHDIWISYSAFENCDAKANFEEWGVDRNARVKVTGKYKFFLKEFDGYWTIYILQIILPDYTNSSYSIVKLDNNTITINGQNFKLVGETTGSDVLETSLKNISAELDADGYVNITIGTAKFKAEDYNAAANFLLHDGDFLELADGDLFCVEETE